MTLQPQPLHELGAQLHLAHEVDHGHIAGERGIGLDLGGRRDARGQHHDVDVTAVEAPPREHGNVQFPAEVRQHHRGLDPGVPPLLGGLLQCLLVAAQQNDPLQPPTLREPGEDRVADLRRATHQQHALHIAQCVDHNPSLSDRSLRNFRSGSTRSRTTANSLALGYIARNVSGDIRESFVR